MSLRVLDLLNPEGLRIDGRRPDELRTMEAAVQVMEHVDGSALLSQGQTKVLVTVSGPKQSTLKQHQQQCALQVEYEYAPFVLGDKKKSQKSDKRLLEKAIFIKQTFEQVIPLQQYPRSQIDIYIKVLQSDGSHFPVALNAVTLALIDAGIPITDYVCAASAGLILDQPILDLNTFEENATFDIPKLTLAVTAREGKVLFMHLESRMHFLKLEKVKDLAVEGARKIYEKLNHTILESTQFLLLKRQQMVIE